MNIKTILGIIKRNVVSANVYPPLTARKEETPTPTNNAPANPLPPPTNLQQK